MGRSVHQAQAQQFNSSCRSVDAEKITGQWTERNGNIETDYEAFSDQDTEEPQIRFTSFSSQDTFEL